MRNNDIKHIIIAGGRGFIGTALTQQLLAQGHDITIISRSPDKVAQQWGQQVAVMQDLTDWSDKPIDWLINLAGAGIADKPWSKERRQILRASRIDYTQNLMQQLDQKNQTPDVIIQASAIGFYGDTADNPVSERQQTKGDGFAATLCHDWESTAREYKPVASRLCLLRTGVVIGREGGMLQRLHRPFSLGFGGKMGNGRQWLSWISIDDLCQLIIFLATHPHCQGPYNATAPHPVTNQAFTQLLGKQLHRPTWLTIPSPLLKIGLGEMASLLLGSQYILPKRAIEAGFTFESATLSDCLAKQYRTRG